MGHILVIDDYLSVRQVLEYYLPIFGHTVVTAEDGPTGLRIAAHETVDLVLVDFDMPRMTGIGVCTALKSNPASRAVPVILMTGRMTQDVVRQAYEAGVLLVLGKPFKWEELLNVLRCLPVATRSESGT